MHSISLMWVNRDVMPNIAAIPRTDASNTMNCFLRLLIVSGISDQACLEGIIICLSVLMRHSFMNLIKYKKDMKQNWGILTWAASCLTGCIVLLHSEGKTQEEIGNFRGPPSCGHSRGEGRRCQFCFQPHHPGTRLCVVQWELVIIKASCLPGGNTMGSSHCLCPFRPSASSQQGAELANVT